MVNEKLADVIYVRLNKDNDGSTYLTAFDVEENAVEDEDVTEVGVYKLERIKKLRKVVQEV